MMTTVKQETKIYVIDNQKIVIISRNKRWVNVFWSAWISPAHLPHPHFHWVNVIEYSIKLITFFHRVNISSVAVLTIILCVHLISIYTFSGEDEKHKACELDRHGPSVRGWQSSKDCSYPQELVLCLQNSATLHQIQILAHQYLIRKYFINNILFLSIFPKYNASAMFK